MGKENENEKLLTLLLALMMIFSLTACKPGGDDPAVKTYKVGVAIYRYNDNFMTLYREEIASYFKSLETDTVKYDLSFVDGKDSMDEQSNQIDTFIAQNGCYYP